MQPPVFKEAVKLNIPFWNYFNPVWLCDSFERPTNTTYLSWWGRQIFPPNFGSFVIGVQAHDHTFAGTKNSNDIFAEKGSQWGIVKCGWIRLPLWSYKDDHREIYIGWRPSGAFGFAWRKSGAHAWVNP
jgi:hypothetical protein